MRLGGLIVAGAMIAGAAVAADLEGHAKFHHWYHTLKQPDNAVASCCNNQDCRPVKYRVTPQGVSMLINGRWLVVPQSKVMEKETPDQGAHWCGVREQSEDPHTYCAVIPRGAV